MIGKTIGAYQILAELGRGGMGEVYRATDTKLKRQVAIKILPPSVAADHDRLARFQREAEVLASLNHPNIAAIYGLEESGGMTALVMELVEGEDLSTLIARGPSLSPTPSRSRSRSPKEADFMMFRDVPHGNLVEHQYLNQLTKVARRVVVYTPPDYNTGNKKYPVVYLLHGANDYEMGWTQSGMANTIMDNLIADKKAVPAIIVMPFGHEKTGAAGRQPEIAALQKALGYTPPPPVARGAAPRAGGPAAGAAGRGGLGFGAPSASGWTMEKEMLDYVIPYVEKEFRVIKDKDHRAIMGYSMGGGHATSIGFGHPDLFAYVGAFSGFGSTNLLVADPAKTNKNYKMIFIGAGVEDTAVNGGRTMHDALTKAGVKHTWSEDPGYGHDYQIWRQYFYRLMQQTFRD